MTDRDQKLDSRVLSQLLLMQNILCNLPNEISIYEFVCRGLADLPGVERVYHQERPLPESLSSQVFSLKVDKFEFGHLALVLNQPRLFEPYRETVKNFCFMVAVILESRVQSRLIRQHQADLEQRVSERTLELTCQIDERMKIEASLRESEDRLRIFTEASNEAIIIHEEGMVHRANQQFFDLFGFLPEEILGKPSLHLFVAPPSMENALVRIQTQDLSSYEFLGRKKDGSIFPLESKIRLITLEGRPMRIAILRDLTEQKQNEQILIQAKEKAEAASQAKSNFLAVMSHELRTPLNGVLGMTEVLMIREQDQSKKKHLETVYSSGQALLHLLTDIMSIARIEAGRFSVKEGPFSLQQVVSRIRSLFMASSRSSGVELDCLISTFIPPLLVGDPDRLSEILSNLLGNALKFTQHGWVRLSVSLQSRAEQEIWLLFEVQDTGIGIEPAMQEVIFEPFTQVDSSSSRSYGGAGLGLAITRSLVELLGGHIKLESKPGEGTKVQVSLPFKPAAGLEEQVKDALLTRPPLQSHQSISVLVVEDDPDNQKVICQALEEFNCQVELAHNGVQGLEKVRAKKYDLLLMDCIMPIMDGYELTRAIRQQERSGQIAGPNLIVALTARAMEGDREKCLKAGMDDYLSKPISLGQINDLLSRYLSPNPLSS